MSIRSLDALESIIPKDFITLYSIESLKEKTAVLAFCLENKETGDIKISAKGKIKLDIRDTLYSGVIHATQAGVWQTNVINRDNAKPKYLKKRILVTGSNLKMFDINYTEGDLTNCVIAVYYVFTENEESAPDIQPLTKGEIIKALNKKKISEKINISKLRNLERMILSGRYSGEERDKMIKEFKEKMAKNLSIPGSEVILYFIDRDYDYIMSMQEFINNKLFFGDDIKAKFIKDNLKIVPKEVNFFYSKEEKGKFAEKAGNKFSSRGIPAAIGYVVCDYEQLLKAPKQRIIKNFPLIPVSEFKKIFTKDNFKGKVLISIDINRRNADKILGGVIPSSRHFDLIYDEDLNKSEVLNNLRPDTEIRYREEIDTYFLINYEGFSPENW